MNRSPAFQFYPDKWQSHTRRLSDKAYRVFHELLCWMWQHSPNHCSITASAEAVSCALAITLSDANGAISEIQNEFSPLLKLERGKWVCNGLRKEAEKQEDWRGKSSLAGKASAAARRLKMVQPPLNDGANLVQPKSNIPSPTPSPTPIKNIPVVTGEHKAFIEGWVQNYKESFNCDYRFETGRDGKAVKELLSMGIMRIDLLEIAKKAWKFKTTFNGRQSQTIHGFRAYFNQIQVEVKNENNGKPNSQRIDRSIGTTNEGRANEYSGLGRVAKATDPQRS